jgi:hypothetical protein
MEPENSSWRGADVSVACAFPPAFRSVRAATVADAGVDVALCTVRAA